jgi:hypothetical protein
MKILFCGAAAFFIFCGAAANFLFSATKLA